MCSRGIKKSPELLINKKTNNIELLIKETVDENFPELRSTGTRFKRLECSQQKYPKRNIPRHIIIRNRKAKDKLLKVVSSKKKLSYNRFTTDQLRLKAQGEC